MILKTLWIQRKCSYEGEFAPECLLAVDEYCYEENSNWFDMEIVDKLDENDSDIISHKIIDIEVDQERIAKLLNNVPTIKGKINE